MKSKRKKDMPSLTSLVIRVLAILFSAALCVSYTSLLVNPMENRIPLYFGLFYIPILAVNLLLLIILLFYRSRVRWITAAALLPSLFFIGDYYQFGGKEEKTPEDQKEDISILSYNVGGFSLPAGQRTSRENCKRKIIDLIRSLDSDVVCLQEVYIPEGSSENLIPDRYSYCYSNLYRTSSGGRSGNITLSKFPIRDKGAIRFSRSTNRSMYTDLSIKGNTVRIYNNHLESYSISFTSMVKRSTSGEKLTREIIDVGNKLNSSTRKRTQQVDTLLNHVKNCGRTAFFCGDFNDTPMSYAYTRLKSGMKDSFTEAGSGFGATYSLFWPLLRIDYILVPENYEVCSHKIIRSNLSDHYPIISKLKI